MGFTQAVGAPHDARSECPEGDATVSVHRVESAAPSAGVVVHLECARLDDRARELRAAGFEFLTLPTGERWPRREARRADPADNVLCPVRAGETRRNPPWRAATTG